MESTSGTMNAPKLTIVYVEDEDLVRMTVAAMLSDVGFHVVSCDSAIEGLRACKSLVPDAVLLDLNMPGIDGFELGRRLRDQIGEEVRMVALTGGSTGDYRKRAAFAGFNEFLSKPVSTKTLVNALFPDLPFSIE